MGRLASENLCASSCNARSGCRVYAWSNSYDCITYNDVNNVFRPDRQSSSWKTCVQDDSSYVHDLETLVKVDPECYTDLRASDYTGTLSTTVTGYMCQSWKILSSFGS